MRAIWYERFGPARDVLISGKLPDPAPGPGEVLIRLRASGGNPSDVKLRAGARPGAEMEAPRIVPHSDGAGEIVEVGEGVDPARRGRRVWVWNAQWQRAFGTAAELVALPSAQAVDLPDGVGWDAAACLGIPAMTAWTAVLGDGPVAGKTVLVTGGAGSVGRYAVQMARLAGARVFATVSGPEKAARTPPCDALIDYRRDDVAERVLELTDGRGVDRIAEVEFGGNLAVTDRVLAIGGSVAAYASMAEREPRLPFYSLMFRNVRISLVLVYLLDAETHARGAAALGAWLAEGKLDHEIGGRFPLTETAAAHEAVETGSAAGNVVVEI
ncbi:MAG: NADPH:quinone reductase [Paracoccaceae bacterium]